MSREWELSSSSGRSTVLRLKPTGQDRSCWVSTMSTATREEARAALADAVTLDDSVRPWWRQNNTKRSNEEEEEE